VSRMTRTLVYLNRSRRSWLCARSGWSRPIPLRSVETVTERGRSARPVKSPYSCLGRRMSPHPQERVGDGKPRVWM
jgi:hypothetical protein